MEEYYSSPFLNTGQNGTARDKTDVYRETILVVEDDFDICAHIRTSLEKVGYTVVTADDGEEGLRVYRGQHPARQRRRAAGTRAGAASTVETRPRYTQIRLFSSDTVKPVRGFNLASTFRHLGALVFFLAILDSSPLPNIWGP